MTNKYNTPYENPEYINGMQKLEAKEKEILEKYQIAKQEYKEMSKEVDRIFEEIALFKKSFGIMQNVR